MEPFGDFFKKSTFNLNQKRRHRKPVPGGNMADRKHVNIVPQKYISNNKLNRKVEILKKQPGKFICDSNDMKYIVNTFLKGRMPKQGELKQLPRTNINFYNDSRDGKWYIERR